MQLTVQTDLENALRLLNKALPETDEDLDAFIAEVESDKHPIDTVPPHLKPTAIAEALIQGQMPTTQIVEFPGTKSQSGIEGLKMAARNGDGPLSEETIRKMKEAQED